MLKLATVFSGIGAIEHALDRMQIEHEIVFACDNGDVELELPKVSIDIDSIDKELKSLRHSVRAVEEIIDYASQLDVMITGVENEYEKLLNELAVDKEYHELVNNAVIDLPAEIRNAISETTVSDRKSVV